MTILETFWFFIGYILANVLWLAYVFAYFHLKGKKKLPQAIIWVGAVLLVMTWAARIESYQEEAPKRQCKKEYAALDPQLKEHILNKVEELFGMPDTIIEETGMHLEGKFFGVIRNDDTNMVETEYRLNTELKEHNQYTTNPDSLDYIVILYPYWDTDYYGYGYNHSSSTEMAKAYVLDYKTDSIVKKVNFDTGKNPFMISVNKGSMSTHEKHRLKGEELYQGIMMSNY